MGWVFLMKASIAAVRVDRVIRLVVTLIFLVLAAMIADFFLLGIAGTLSATTISRASRKKFGSLVDGRYVIGYMLTL